MGKKIIITGGLGYIGTELCKIYSGYSWNDEVVVIDNRFISERVNQLRNWNINYVQGDILNKDIIKLRKILSLSNEKIKFGKSSLVGAVTGCIAGLASITPASGSVGPMGGLIIGLIAGGVCYYMVNIVKETFNIDDSLDVFAVHGVGGLLGILLIPFLTAKRYGGIGYDEGSSFSDLMNTQVIGAVSVGLFTLIGSVILLLITKSIFGLRVSDNSQEEGLDVAEHGQSGYKL